MTSSNNTSNATSSNSIFLAAKEGNVDDIIQCISQSQSPNSAGCGGYTPLHIACTFGHRAALEALLLRGGDPEQRTEDGKTVLMIAEEKGFSDIVNLIQAGDWKIKASS
ncbi:Ankyrin-3 [Arthrobotrys entomopaga]|nr:Ankyrin-3 [Arthrobotrys entomopaga]